MKKTAIFITSIFFILAAALLIFSSAHFIAALDYASNESANITANDASAAINESEQIIAEMQSEGFSVNYLNDTLIEAKRVFQQSKYAAILRGDINSTSAERANASAALSLISWQKINYGNVLIYTDEIKNRRETALFLADSIKVEEAKLNGSFAASDATKQILENAKTAFSEERYNDTASLLENFRTAFENEISQSSMLTGLKKGAMNFFQRYWAQIIIFLAVLALIAYSAYKTLEKMNVKNKIKKMEAEEKALTSLMKKNQEDRFKSNSISGLVYNIRTEKYQKKLQSIKEELPVLKKRARSLS